MTPEEVVAAAREAGVRLVRFLYCDNGGIVRGKATHVARLDDRLRTGIGLTVAMQAMSAFDRLQPVEGMTAVGEIRLVGDPDTFTILPYAPHTAALLTDHVRLDGSPYEACPRAFLKRMEARLAARGFGLRCAVENEFSLARTDATGYVPIDRSLCFSTVGMMAAQDVVDAIVEALEAQGIGVEQYYPELGHGQHELSVAHAEALRAADTQVLVRETIRGVAHRFGLVASLAPKPWVDAAGNGAHVHFSLWEGDRNAFHDPGGRFGLSETGEAFVAGLLDHLPGLLALTAPSANSFARLGPGRWASGYVSWGPDNREASVRVPSPFRGLEHETANLELKPADASCNPYVCLGGIAAAGLDGIERGLVPPEPALVDPATLPGSAPYPASLGEALDALEKDDVLMRALGEALARSYVAVRRSEAEVGPDADYFLKY